MKIIHRIVLTTIIQNSTDLSGSKFARASKASAENTLLDLLSLLKRLLASFITDVGNSDLHRQLTIKFPSES